MIARILGLDLSINRTGWCVLDPGPLLVEAGTFDLPARRTREPRAQWNTRRFQSLRSEVDCLLTHWQPALVAWEYSERAFTHWRPGRGTAGSEFNAMSGLALAEGMLVAILAPYDIQARAVSRSDAKRAAAGDPNASKAKVRLWLSRRYGWHLDELSEDAVDAIAVALGALVEPRESDTAKVLALAGRRRGRSR